jgi:hypothetical protein
MSDGASGQRGRSPTRTASAVVVIVLIVGVPWFMVAKQRDEWWLTYETLALLTAGLVVVLGASMSAMRGIWASVVVAAAVIGGMVLGFVAGGHFDNPWTGVSVGIVTVGTLILVPLAWLGGAAIGWAWRWTRRRWLTA